MDKKELIKTFYLIPTIATFTIIVFFIITWNWTVTTNGAWMVFLLSFAWMSGLFVVIIKEKKEVNTLKDKEKTE